MAKLIMINAEWKGNIELNKEVLDYLKKNKIKTLALFSDVQFLKLNKVIKQISSVGIKVIKSKAKRTDADFQILGCDCYSDSFDNASKDAEIFLYIGDGLFHPKALLLSQIKNPKKIDVLIFNPIEQKMKILSREEIIPSLKAKRKNLKLYIHAKKIGILVSTKPGQQYLDNAIKLKKHLRSQNKESFVFIANETDFREFENFNFIDAWINTACPRIGTDDIVNIKKPLINIKDALNPFEELDNLNNILKD